MIRGCRRAPRRDLGCGGATFKHRWADLSQGRVTPPLVIEHFDVVEQLHLRVAATLEVLAELELDRGEERFHDGVVVAIATTTHAAHDPVCGEPPLIVLARIGAALVRVVQQPSLGTPALDRHLERLDREMPVVDRAHGPADDIPRVQIQDRGDEQLRAAADEKLRRVADPALIRPARGELPIQHVAGDRLIVIAHGRHLVAASCPGHDPLLTHQPSDALLADPLAVVDEIFPDARPTVRSTAGLVRRPHAHAQMAIAAGVGRFRAALPRVEAAARDLQTATQDRYRVGGLLRGDEPESYRLCFAKKAVAFFKISRSSWRMRFSLRSRVNSSRSLVVRPVRPCVRSARARLTQSRSAVSVKSRSRAAAPTVFPSSRTKRTALALNSSVNWRRGRLVGGSAIALDIVSSSGKMSTEADQPQTGAAVRTVTVAKCLAESRLRSLRSPLRDLGAVCSFRVP